MRSPNSSARRSREIFQLSNFLICRMGMSSPRAGRGHKISKNVQVNRNLLELRGRHVAVLQMKVLQITLVRQLVAESFTFCLFLPKIEVSSARSRESPDTSCSSVAVGSCHTGGAFLLRTGAAGRGIGGTKGAKVSVISSLVTPFVRRFFPWCRLHKWLVISITRDNGMIPLRKGSLIFIFMHVLCMSWKCCF